jgi:hypothetical protein
MGHSQRNEAPVDQLPLHVSPSTYLHLAWRGYHEGFFSKHLIIVNSNFLWNRREWHPELWTQWCTNRNECLGLYHFGGVWVSRQYQILSLEFSVLHSTSESFWREPCNHQSKGNAVRIPRHGWEKIVFDIKIRLYFRTNGRKVVLK